MKTRPLNIAKPDYQALQDELERRYGPALAQDIVDQIRRTEDADFVPDYMAVKGASEVLELFRGEARESLRKLRQADNAVKAANDNHRLVNFEEARLRKECERLLGLYLLSQRALYRMYRKAIKNTACPATRNPVSRKRPGKLGWRGERQKMLQTKNNNHDGVISMNNFPGREFDEELGKRLKLLRHSRRMSMDNLGACIGVCGQQIHKYEIGESRMPPARLAACARMFGVPVGYFFGEGEGCSHRRFDKAVVTVAAEVHELTFDVRQGFYSLMRAVNKMQNREETAEDNKSNSAKAA